MTARTPSSDVPVVSILTLAYNHAPYIRACIESVLMQQTSFRFEHIIHDDASTDATASIIREYADRHPESIRFVCQTENQYRRGVAIGQRFLYPLVRGRYVAFCEGDDAWTDPLKLQKQVDYMEAHPACGLCYTQVERYVEARHEVSCTWGGAAESLGEFLGGNTVPTATVLIRAELLWRYVDEIRPAERGWAMGDYPMWLYAAAESQVRFLPCVTGIYRILSQSASHSMSLQRQLEFYRAAIDIRLFFVDRYAGRIAPRLAARQRLRYWKTMLRLAGLRGDDAAVAEARRELRRLPWGTIGRLKLPGLLPLYAFPKCIMRFENRRAARKAAW